MTVENHSTISNIKKPLAASINRLCHVETWERM